MEPRRKTSQPHVVFNGTEPSRWINATGARVSSTPLGQQPTLYKRAGLGVLAPELSEWKSGANVVAYTPGISEKRGTTSTWSHSGIKNFDYQSKSNGTVSSARRYDAFGDGQTQVSGSYWRGPWGYGGPFGYYSTNYGPQLIGMETGFTPTEPIKQVGHRWYDASIGRFISRDPAKDGVNWFTYCSNEPVTGVDATGLQDNQSSVTTAPGYAEITELAQIEAELSGSGISTTSHWVNAAKFVKHHAFPQAFRSRFARMGIEIDKWLIRTPEWFHKYLHRKGFKFPGGWLNKKWKDFLDANPNASGRDAMRFLRRLMDEAGLKDVSLKDLFIRK